MTCKTNKGGGKQGRDAERRNTKPENVGTKARWLKPTSEAHMLCGLSINVCKVKNVSFRQRIDF